MIKVTELLFKYDDLKLEGEPIAGALPIELGQEALGEIVGPSGYWVKAPIEVTGHIYKTPSGEVIVDGRLNGSASFDCVSCGQRRSLPVSVREDLIVVPKGHAASREEDVEGEGELSLSPDLYIFEGQELDLAEVFREVLILNVLTHPRCDDVDEECGPSLAERGSDQLPETSDIDPRWAPLLAMHDQLKSKDDQSES